MDSKGFFLGVIAAIVLFLLWKKEQGSNFLSTLVGSQPGSGAPCPGCAGGPGAAASPSYQATLAVSGGGDGFVTPGTPPLNSVFGAGSLYSPTGPTPDTGFTSSPAKTGSITSEMLVAGVYGNVPGSATTPADQVPVRATQVVAPYSGGGFVSKYNISGVPLAAREAVV